MKLSLAEKQTFYHDLGRFVQSGIPMSQAVESMATDSRGSLRSLLKEMLRLLLGGESVVGTFSSVQPAVGHMEVALVQAADRSGRLEQAFAYLSQYFGALAEVRGSIFKRALWPVIQLHLGVVLLNFATEMVAGATSGGGFNMAHFALHCADALSLFYAIAILGIGGGWMLARAGRTDVSADGFLAMLPIVGKLRRNLALSRFCAAYEMQLAAGVNVSDSLQAAADSSQSARVRAASQAMAPGLMNGQSVGTLMNGFRVFPPALQRSVRTGEEAGGLDADLRRWADYYQKAAVDSMEAAGGWLSRLVTTSIVLYLGYKIVTTYQAVISGTYGQLLE